MTNYSKEINNIYHNITKKFYEVLQTLDFNKDELVINYIREKYGEVIALLNGGKDMNVLRLLNEISFIDHLKDKSIFETVQNNRTMVFVDNLFVKVGNLLFKDDEAVYEITEENNNYIAKRYLNGEIAKENISICDLDNFVSLKKALDDSEYIGYIAKQWTDWVSLLYSGKVSNDMFFTLYKINGILKFYISDVPYDLYGGFQDIRKERHNVYIETGQKNRKLNCDNNDTGDKAFIYDAIVEQIHKQYENAPKYIKSRK